MSVIALSGSISFILHPAVLQRLLLPLVSLAAGIIDGIKTEDDGSVLVSHWEGQVYRVTPAGQVIRILDTMPELRNTADFELISELGMVVMPTFVDNRVVAYRLN